MRSLGSDSALSRGGGRRWGGIVDIIGFVRLTFSVLKMLSKGGGQNGEGEGVGRSSEEYPGGGVVLLESGMRG